MKASFHLSFGVKSMEESITFFTDVLTAKVVHRDPSGYVNISLFGSQITLKPNDEICPDLPDFHFGINLDLVEFEKLANHIAKCAPNRVVMKPTVVDANTSLERKKMYLKCPTGYLIELKGYVQGESAQWI